MKLVERMEKKATQNNKKKKEKKRKTHLKDMEKAMQNWPLIIIWMKRTDQSNELQQLYTKKRQNLLLNNTKTIDSFCQLHIHTERRLS